MELDKIETLIEKYFDGETSITEEKQLKDYFSSPDVAQHLDHYKPMFGYFSSAKQQRFEPIVPQFPKARNPKRKLAWLSVAASVVVLFGAGITYFNYENTAPSDDLGTYDNPEVAFRETQKALSLLSTNVNTGIESVQYIQNYEDSKNLIFKN